MLSSLSLNNVALIKKQEIEFGAGFNCLLGASGAGKSVVISGLSFLLGAKADKNLVRTGENTLRVDAVFQDLNDEVKNLLNEFEIEYDGELILTRTLSADGKSSSKINGCPVTTKMLKDLGDLLVDFCGQHDSVGLLNQSNHITLLDKFAGEELSSVLSQVEECYDEIKEIDKKISSIGGNEAERSRTKDILSFQIREIEEANLEIAEEEILRERFSFISSAESIFEHLSDAVSKLENSQNSAISLLYDAKSSLNQVSNFKDIEECKERIENAYYEMKDVCETLQQIKNNTEFDPIELERIDERLELIKKLEKKYGHNIEAILDYLDKTKAQLEELENSENILEELNKKKDDRTKELLSLCEKASQIRKAFAKKLESGVERELEDLEMKGTHFKVDFEKGECGRNGFDNVKFMFSANAGQNIRDLNKTASGGELSRLLLAFKNVMREKEFSQSVVFDEIDAGMSGAIAEKLASKIQSISSFCQVICITHTAVVAIRGDKFLLVEKNVEDGNTFSRVKTLNNKDEIFSEVAKLIDGAKTTSALELVRDMYARAHK